MSIWYKIDFSVQTRTFSNFPQDEILIVGGQQVLVPATNLSPSISNRQIYSGLIVEDFVYGPVSINEVEVDGSTVTTYTGAVVSAAVVEQHDASSFVPDIAGIYRRSTTTEINGETYTNLGGTWDGEILQGGSLRNGMLSLLGPNIEGLPQWHSSDPTIQPPVPDFAWVLIDDTYVAGEPYFGFPESFNPADYNYVYDFKALSQSTRTVIWTARDWRFSGSTDDTIILPTREEAYEIRDQYWNKGTAVAFIRHEVLGHEAFWSGDGNDSIDASMAEPIPWFLYGEGGNDTLIGGSRDDLLSLGTGENRLTGNGGADRFAAYEWDTINRSVLSIDTITDFNRSEADLIDLTEWDADPFQSGNQDFVLRNSFSGRRGEVVVERVDDSTQEVLIDTTGNRAANHKIVVEGLFSPLGVDDFLGVAEAEEVYILPGEFGSEGDDPETAGTSRIFVSLSKSYSEDVHVEYETIDDTATLADNDYVPQAGTLTFQAGEQLKFLEVEFTGDTKREDNERVGVRLLTAQTASGNDIPITTDVEYVTIRNDDTITVSLQPVGDRLFDLYENGPDGQMQITLSEAVDFRVLISATITGSHLEQDVNFSDLRVLPGQTERIDPHFIHTIRDNVDGAVEEGIETGRLTFTAQNEDTGEPLDIIVGQSIQVNIHDEIRTPDPRDLDGARLTAEQFVSNMAEAAEDSTHFLAALDPVAAATNKRIGLTKALGHIGNAAKVASLAADYRTDLESAKEIYLRSPPSIASKRALATRFYEAEKSLFVESADTLVEGLAAAGSVQAALYVGAFLAGTSVAAIPLTVVAATTLVVGAAAGVGYDASFKSWVRSSASNLFETTIDRSAYVRQMEASIESVKLSPQDGYLSGATIFADEDGDLILDAGELSTTSDADGFGDFLFSGSPLVAFGGTDVSTGLPFEGILVAPAGSTVINPLTSLLYFMSGDSQAQEKIATAFGLDPNLNFTQFDPIQGTIDGTQGAAEAFAAAAKIYTSAAVIGASLSQASGLSLPNAISISLQVLAERIGTGNFDPTDQTQLASLISSVFAQAAVPISAGAVGGLNQVQSALLAEIETAANGGGTQALASIAAVQNVALGPLVDDLETTELNDAVPGALLDRYTGTGLQTAISEFNALVGSDNDDRLDGTGADETFSGLGGNDIILPGGGEDFVHGGLGNDTVSFLTLAHAVSVNLSTGVATSGTEASTLESIENIIASTFGDNITGDGNDNHIQGLGGGDWINSRGGNDTIDGGDGRDMVSFSGLRDTPGRTNQLYRLDIDLTAGTAVSHDGSEQMVLRNIERITGSIFADRIKGTAGDDQLRGLGDYDWFIATTGADTLDGGTSKDMVSYVDWQSATANARHDFFSTSGAPPVPGDVTGVVVDLADPSNNTHLAAGHSYSSIERITGSGRQDVFWGDENENDFRGLGDYDWFVGSAGGRERYFGGAGDDTVTYFRSTAGVTASLRNGALVNGQETGYGTGGDAARDLFFEIENLIGTAHGDQLTGNSGSNQISGLSGDDLLFGYSDRDYLKGGLGNDTIDGGAGSDVALFTGNWADYTITKTGGRSAIVDGPDGTDRVLNMEYFRFADADVAIWDL
jgi:Ca2+-binding RTX toxin-like protein